MLLPGPEAQQLAIYTGWLLNGVLGGLIAGSLFVLSGIPRAPRVVGDLHRLSATTTLVTAIFAGLAPAVIAVVIQALHRVAKRSLTHAVL